MSRKGAFTVTCADFPKSDGFVSGAGEDEIAFRVEVDVRYVMVMAVKGLKAEIVIVDVP